MISSVSLRAYYKIRYALSIAHNFRPMQFLTPITILGGLAHAAVRIAQSQWLARPNDDLEFRSHSQAEATAPIQYNCSPCYTGNEAQATEVSCAPCSCPAWATGTPNELLGNACWGMQIADTPELCLLPAQSQLPRIRMPYRSDLPLQQLARA